MDQLPSGPASRLSQPSESNLSKKKLMDSWAPNDLDHDVFLSSLVRVHGKTRPVRVFLRCLRSGECRLAASSSVQDVVMTAQLSLSIRG